MVRIADHPTALQTLRRNKENPKTACAAWGSARLFLPGDGGIGGMGIARLAFCQK